MSISAASGLAACGRPGSGADSSAKAPAAPVEMEFLHFFTGVLWENGFKPIIDRFEATHPNVKWRGNVTPYGEMHTKIVTLAAAGTPPDGMSVWERAFNQKLAPCWRCERNADDAARTIAPVVNELLKQRPKSF